VGRDVRRSGGRLPALQRGLLLSSGYVDEARVVPVCQVTRFHFLGERKLSCCVSLRDQSPRDVEQNVNSGHTVSLTVRLYGSGYALSTRTLNGPVLTWIPGVRG
jgi:hypothetical protein